MLKVYYKKGKKSIVQSIKIFRLNTPATAAYNETKRDFLRPYFFNGG